MPKCGLKLKGVAMEWALSVELVTRLTTEDRLFVKSGVDDMKACNKDAAHNHAALQPLLKCMADHANWELFALPEITKQLLGSKLVCNVYTGYWKLISSRFLCIIPL